MITRYIVHFNPPAEHAGDLFDDLHMALGPVFFTELPDINNIAVKNKDRRVNSSQIPAKFICLAAISAEMHIRDNYDIDLSFFQGLKFMQNYIPGIALP